MTSLNCLSTAVKALASWGSWRWMSGAVNMVFRYIHSFWQASHSSKVSLNRCSCLSTRSTSIKIPTMNLPIHNHTDISEPLYKSTLGCIDTIKLDGDCCETVRQNAEVVHVREQRSLYCRVHNMVQCCCSSGKRPMLKQHAQQATSATTKSKYVDWTVPGRCLSAECCPAECA